MADTAATAELLGADFCGSALNQVSVHSARQKGHALPHHRAPADPCIAHSSRTLLAALILWTDARPGRLCFSQVQQEK